MAISIMPTFRERRLKRAARALAGAALVAAAFVAVACEPLPLFEHRASEFVPGFEGGAAGDEPASVLVAQEILAAGGSAADAVVAAYFNMSVALPSSASLGGGGICHVYDQEKRTSEFLLFLDDHGTAGRIPAPLNLRGMYALQAKYGVLAWRQLIVRSENTARFGFPVSRALARDLAAAWPSIPADSALRRMFGGPDGAPLGEGDMLRQPELAATLARIRRDPLRVFQGAYARRLAAAYRRAGVPMTLADMRAARPRWAEPVRVEAGNQIADFPPTPAGVTAAQMWAILYREGTWRRADEADRSLVVVEAARRAFADAGRWFRDPTGLEAATGRLLSEEHVARLAEGIDDPRVRPVPQEAANAGLQPAERASASIVATDRFGQSVACGFSMNGAMGALRVAPGPGIVIAAAPDAARLGTVPIALMSLRLGAQYQLEFMGAATGGAAAPTVLNATALEAFLGSDSLEAALALPRAHPAGGPGRVVVERGAGGDAIAARLSRAGYAVDRVPALGRVNGLNCPAGFEGARRSRCEMRTDRRGFGFARQN